MFGQDRQQLRQMFFQCWQKHLDQRPLEPLEAMIVDVIMLHPEYHTMLGSPEDYVDKDYSPEMGETNPFLHMAMHISIREQLSTNRPDGIQALYEQLCQKSSSIHDVEHIMMDCLGIVLWEAQRSQTMPDDRAYIECVRNRL